MRPGDEDDFGEPLVNPFRAAEGRFWLLALAVLLVGGAASAAIAALAPNKWLLIFPLIPSIALLLVFVLTAVVCRFFIPGVDRQLDAFRRGKQLCRWTYGPQEWGQFLEREWERKRLWIFLIAIILLILGILIGAGAAGGVEGAGPAALGWLGGCLLAGLYSWLVWRHHLRSRRRVPVTYIGARGIYYNGSYHPFSGFGNNLQEARLDPGPPAVLELTLGTSDQDHTLRVLVPAGSEHEARALVKALR